MARKKVLKSKPNEKRWLSEPDFLLASPAESARHLDAILYFIHKRYVDSNSPLIPDLGSFLITRADVVFSDQVDHIVIEKRPAMRTLQILAPSIAANDEEPRRIFLLNEFAELIIKYQKQAYMQIRDMLLRVTDPLGREKLIAEFESYRASLK